MSELQAPFPYFGGKSAVAAVVWERLGDVPNYVEPFFGSGAVLLARPHEPKIETVNDKDGFVANFWRAVQHVPEGVAYYADWPVFENDLHARHAWLVNQRSSLVETAGRRPRLLRREDCWLVGMGYEYVDWGRVREWRRSLACGER